MALTKIHSRMIDSDIINVRDYGATGDGSTNLVTGQSWNGSAWSSYL